MATTQPHPAHHQTPQGIPYHMHHSLIQHLTDMRDLYGSHQSITGISNHHNSNWKMRIIFFYENKNTMEIILWYIFEAGILFIYFIEDLWQIRYESFEYFSQKFIKFLPKPTPNPLYGFGLYYIVM